MLSRLFSLLRNPVVVWALFSRPAENLESQQIICSGRALSASWEVICTNKVPVVLWTTKAKAVPALGFTEQIAWVDM